MKLRNFFTGLVISGQVACGSPEGTEVPPQGILQEHNINTSEPNEISDQIQERQSEVINSAENLAQIEQEAWQKIIDSTPEMVALNRVEELWSNPTPDFLEYMRLWDTHDLGLEPLYRHGLLNRNIYERYMDVVSDYEEFSRYINSIIAYLETTNEFTDEAKERFRMVRNDQLNLLSRMSQVIPTLQSQNNYDVYRNAVRTTMERIQAARPENNHSYLSRSSASDPLLAEALIFIETLPTLPNEVSTELVRLHGIAMLQTGFQANAKLSISDLPQFRNRLETANRNNQTGLGTTKHVTSGFPHLTYSSANDIFTLIYNNQEIWPYNQVHIDGLPLDANFVSKHFEKVMTDINFATAVFVCMVHDNRSRFANYINDDPLAVNFIRNEDNQLAFVALTAMFNNIGGTEKTFEFAYRILVDSNYNAEMFIEKLGDPTSYEQWNSEQPTIQDIQISSTYVRRSVRMYQELTDDELPLR